MCDQQNIGNSELERLLELNFHFKLTFYNPILDFFEKTSQKLNT